MLAMLLMLGMPLILLSILVYLERDRQSEFSPAGGLHGKKSGL